MQTLEKRLVETTLLKFKTLSKSILQVILIIFENSLNLTLARGKIKEGMLKKSNIYII